MAVLRSGGSSLSKYDHSEKTSGNKSDATLHNPHIINMLEWCNCSVTILPYVSTISIGIFLPTDSGARARARASGPSRVRSGRSTRLSLVPHL